MSHLGTHEIRVNRRAAAGFLVSTVVIATSCAAGMAPGSPGVGDGYHTDGVDVAIVGVSVIPVDRDIVLDGRTVLIRNGRIVSITSAGAVVPGAERVVDGAGRYLIPGLADMHTHVYGETELLLYVANGVTRIRNLWGSHTALAMRARADSGTVISPRIHTAGRLVDGAPPVWGEVSAVARDPATARAIMDEEKAAGFDFLKIYEQLSAETFDAIMAHSRDAAYPVAGHVPRAVPLEHALRSGMASIEHLSSWAAATEVFRPKGPNEAAALLRRIESGDAGWDVLYDSVRLRSLAALAAEGGVWHVPTLSWTRRVYTSRRQARDLFAGPNMRFISPLRRAIWDPNTNFGLQRLSDETLEAFQILLEADQLRVRALHEAGARLLVGTDAANPFVLPGFAVHEELELLVESGLSNYDALVAATREPAEFVGRLDQGAIFPGSSADLVLLESNPLLNISATREIAGVMLRGRWFSREDLDAMLDTAVQRYRQPEDWFVGVAPMPKGEDVLTYSTAERGQKIRAERIWDAGEEEAARVTFAQRATLTVSGDQVDETLEITTRDDGSISQLIYTQVPASGSARVAVHDRDGRLTLVGHTVDGQSIEKSVVLEPGEIVSCEMTACLTLMLPRVEKLGIDERRRLQVRTLVATAGSRGEASGNPTFVVESWEWVRMPDDGDSAVYDVTVSRDGGQWTLKVTVDATGLLKIDRGGRRQLETRRERRGDKPTN